jgi:hypothetical protein
MGIDQLIGIPGDRGFLPGFRIKEMIAQLDSHLARLILLQRTPDETCAPDQLPGRDRWSTDETLGNGSS